MNANTTPLHRDLPDCGNISCYWHHRRSPVPVEQFSSRKDRVTEKAGYAATDAFQRSAQLVERERCGKMLDEYIGRGHSPQEIVAYAVSLLKTDY